MPCPKFFCDCVQAITMEFSRVERTVRGGVHVLTVLPVPEHGDNARPVLGRAYKSLAHLFRLYATYHGGVEWHVKRDMH